ncbi:MAG: PQQ-dependent sugar dehydrogenase, partial [Desulforhabdus sp.]|nr:PQQ-dependent sugar dehydrogenase [Desulforhabdus sp.]
MEGWLMLAGHRGPGRKAVRILLMSVTLSFLCCSIGFAASGLDSRPTSTTCVALAKPAGTNYRLTRVFSPISFNRPVGVQQSPNNGQRWYVIEQSGRVMTFLNGDQQASVFVDVAQKITTAGGEQGLLGMALHPSYPGVPYVYLSYTAALDGRSVISRFTKSGAGDFLEPSSEVMILQQPQPYANHNGGEIAFGPDGYLYVGLGDGGSGGDPLDNG